MFIVTMLATAWLGFAQPSRAQGTISYHQPSSPIILWTQGFAEYYPFDIDDNGTSELTFAYNFQSIGILYEQNTRTLSLMSPWPSIRGVPQPLPADFRIGPDSSSGQLQWFGGIPGEPVGSYGLVFISGTGASGSFAGQHAYMGIEFQRNGASHYGWMLLQVSGSFAAVAAIESWAWETRPGEAILAGTVPEPSTWALLVGGGVLMLWFRRKRHEGRG
ncbi:MAG TPA: PEP-CTERM sorting domain-containing protein [Verrucomicrobiota bacterium]|nr:PEP-CTERM sorting domain-containing protein [Verrucomicrobiota bacterium]HPK99692.1 PEP-CTERM sorting domain-containing protein [Verrucomicrobiota bacterium]